MIFIAVLVTRTQALNWYNYTNCDQIRTFCDDGNVLWIGTNGGLVHYDRSTQVGTILTMASSGLPGNIINRVMRDLQGRLWVATQGGGVASNDGSGWIRHRSGIQGTEITALAQDSLGNIWIGTTSTYRCIFRFDGTRWDDLDYDPPAFAHTRDIVVDHEGTVWIGLYRYGLLRYDGGTTFTEFTPDNCGLGNEDVYELGVDRDNLLYVGTAEGIYTFDGDSGWSSGSSDLIMDINTDDSGNVWSAADTRIARHGNTVSRGKTFYVYLGDGRYQKVRSVHAEKGGRIWAGTDHGVYVREISETTGDFTVDHQDAWGSHLLFTNSGLPRNYIYDIFTAGDSVWVAASGGLVLFDGEAWITFTQLDSLVNEDIFNTVKVGSDGSVWAGTNNRGLLRFDGNEWIRFDTLNSDLPSNKINALAEDDSGYLWIGTSMGIARFREDTGWTTYSSTAAGVGSGYVRALAVSPSGEIWVGIGCGPFINGQGGLVRFDGDTTWTRYYSGNSGLTHNNVYSLAFAQDGRLFVGTESEETTGLSLAAFDGDTTWTKFDEIKRDFINDLAFDGDGNLYLATWSELVNVGGLVRLNRDGSLNDWDKFDSPVPESDVMAVAVDKSGNVWIGTRGGGVAVYNPEGLKTVRAPRVGFVKNAFTLKVWPNPCRSRINIALNGLMPAAEPPKVQVFDSRGVLVQTLPACKGGATFIWNAEGRAPGIYYVKADADGGSVSRRVMLVR